MSDEYFYVGKAGDSAKRVAVFSGPIIGMSAVEEHLGQLPPGDYEICRLVERVNVPPRTFTRLGLDIAKDNGAK